MSDSGTSKRTSTGPEGCTNYRHADECAVDPCRWCGASTLLPIEIRLDRSADAGSMAHDGLVTVNYKRLREAAKRIESLQAEVERLRMVEEDLVDLSKQYQDDNAILRGLLTRVKAHNDQHRSLDKDLRGDIDLMLENPV